MKNRLIFFITLMGLNFATAVYAQKTSPFPVVGFYQNGKVVIPSFQNYSSLSMPLELYGWRMEAKSDDPTPAELKKMGPFKLIYEEKLERSKLSTVPGSDKWLVPQGVKAALLYRFDKMPSPIEEAGVPVVLFDQELSLVADYQRRSVAYADKEYLDNLGFKDVEKTYTALWATLSSAGKMYRIVELPNGAGSSYFLNTIEGLECTKTQPLDFYSDQKTQPAAEDEMMAAACGDLGFQ